MPRRPAPRLIGDDRGTPTGTRTGAGTSGRRAVLLSTVAPLLAVAACHGSSAPTVARSFPPSPSASTAAPTPSSSTASPSAPAASPSAPAAPSPSVSPAAVGPSAGATTAAARALGAVDGWGDRTYPSGCLGGSTVTLAGGTASAGGGTVRQSLAYTGDLTGDGLDDVVVELSCTPAGAPEHDDLYAYSAATGRVTRVGTLLSADDDQTVQAVKPYQGNLVVGSYAWTDGADRKGKPNTLVTTVWAYRDGALVQQNRYTDPVGVLDPEGD